MGKTADGLLCLDAVSAILPADPGIYVHVIMGMMSTEYARRKRCVADDAYQRYEVVTI